MRMCHMFEAGKYEHDKERNERYKNKPNGTCVVKLQQQKLSKMKQREKM